MKLIVDFNLLCINLDENAWIRNAVEKYFREDLLKRRVSCEFHFQQSGNKRFTDSMVPNQLSSHQFQAL